MNLRQMEALLPELVKAAAENDLTNPVVTEERVDLKADTSVAAFRFGTYNKKTVLLLDEQGEIVYRTVKNHQNDLY